MKHAIFGALVAFIALAYRLGKEQARREARRFAAQYAERFFVRTPRQQP